MLTQSLAAHKDLLKQRSEQIDYLNQQIRDFSALQKQDIERVHELKESVRLRAERKAKISNLKRSVAEKRRENAHRSKHSSTPTANDIDPPWLDQSSQEILHFSSDTTDISSPNDLQRQHLTANVPSPRTLKAHLNAYLAQNGELHRHADELKSRSSQLEGMYRKVVSLCTGVEEARLEEALPALVAAVESERGALFGEGEVGRVREFLRRVVGAGASSGVVQG